MIVHGGEVKPGQKFRFKRSRGVGSFLVSSVVEDRRVILQDRHSGQFKELSRKTLCSDYERMEA